jgi:hypothetical protein
MWKRLFGTSAIAEPKAPSVPELPSTPAAEPLDDAPELPVYVELDDEPPPDAIPDVEKPG